MQLWGRSDRIEKTCKSPDCVVAPDCLHAMLHSQSKTRSGWAEMQNKKQLSWHSLIQPTVGHLSSLACPAIGSKTLCMHYILFFIRMERAWGEGRWGHKVCCRTAFGTWFAQHCSFPGPAQGSILTRQDEINQTKFQLTYLGRMIAIRFYVHLMDGTSSYGIVKGDKKHYPSFPGFSRFIFSSYETN